MKRLLSLPMIVALGAACSATPTVIPTRNLERPTDVTFVCLGVNGDQLAGQPMTACHQRNAIDPGTTVDGQRVRGTFAFIANPGRDEIAVADMDRGRLLDLSPLTPGYGMLPAGKNPLAIASSQDGRWVVTANRNSCDFTMVDPVRLLAGTFPSASATAAQGGPVSQSISVQTQHSGRLYASTGEIAFLPASVAPARAVATFPGCDLVALLDFSFDQASATVVDSYYVRADRLVAAGMDPVCPTECERDAVDAGLSIDADNPNAGVDTLDGGTGSASVDAGASASSYLQALALVPEGTKVYVGSLNGDSIASLDISPTGFAPSARLTLAEGAGGVRRLRLGVDPYGTTGTAQGAFLDARGRFLYAFTNDDSVRVIKIGDQGDSTYAQTPVECDANLVLPSGDVQSCHSIGEGIYARRPLVRGPGLQVPLQANMNPNNPPPVPRDIAFAELVPSGDGYYQSLSGQFGFLLAANGQVYVLNVAPNPARGDSSASDGTIPAPTATHSFREERVISKSGPPAFAFSAVPQRIPLSADQQPFATIENFSAQEGPLIQSFLTASTSSSSTSTITNYLSYPDPNSFVSRSWYVTWEGALPQASRATGVVKTQAGFAGILSDNGADFCGSGVQPGDIVMFTGCTQNSDCLPDDQFTCRSTVSGGRSMCLPVDAKVSSQLVDQCTRFLKSRMRYEVAEVTATSLKLQLKLDEVPKTSLNPCQTNADCRLDGRVAPENADGGGTSNAFTCLAMEGGERRCVQSCRVEKGIVHDEDCRAGHVCDSARSLCVEAPPIDPACLPQPLTAYSVRAGRAFTVSGTSMPNVSPFRRSASGACVAQQLPPTLVNRIPLSAPQCPAAFLAQAPKGGATLVQQLAAQAGFDPCIYQGSYNDGSSPSTTDAGAHEQAIFAFFQNPQIRFVLSNLDKYPGDLLSIHFALQQETGYLPWTVQIPSYEILLTMGARIISGPTQTPESPIRSNASSLITYPYLYVIDQGQSALTAGSHGQIVRINPRGGGNQLATFDLTLSGNTPFQIQ